MKVKVCGMREAANIRAVESLPQVQALGFIFAPRSPRFVSEKPSYLPERCQRVGVFVDAEAGEIVTKVDDYGLHVVQLHGRETPQFCQRLRPLLPPHVQIWKALPIRQVADFALARAYEAVADLFLLETKATQRVGEGNDASPLSHLTGGTGQQFDWQLLSHYDSERPFLLSGGIGPADADRIKSLSHPRLAGIDLNSRFESLPGVKNIDLLKQFLSELQ